MRVMSQYVQRGSAMALALLLAMPVGTPSGLPPFVRVVFGVFAVIVVGVWGRWWYAQRKHFYEIEPMSR